jgi:hypothetical protein
MAGLILRAFEIIETGWTGTTADLADLLHREGYSLAELHQFTGTALRKQLQQAMKQVASRKVETDCISAAKTDARQASSTRKPTSGVAQPANPCTIFQPFAPVIDKARQT